MDQSTSSLSTPDGSLSAASSPSQDLADPGWTLLPDSEIDTRPDTEIIAELKTYREPTSDKNVWAFWHSGFDSMRPWTQRNVLNWVRRLGRCWTIHVLDRVPGSPVNVLRYIDASQLPDVFINGTMTGPHVGAHSGDLVRLPLLYRYGGVWMDAGLLLFRHLDDICWNAIEDPSSPYEMSGIILELRPSASTMLNGFIAAKRENPFIRRWHDIYLALWDGVTESAGFHKHPLLSHIPLISPPTSKMDFPDSKIAPELYSDYLAHFMCFDRLRALVDPADGFNGPEYFAEKMCLFDGLQELYLFDHTTGWSGSKQFELLSTPRDVTNDNYTEAERLVEAVLANTAMIKLSHGPRGALDPLLATLWDEPRHHDKDNERGTFAEYLRYGSVHFKQTRAMQPAKLEATEGILHIGVLEPKK